MKHRFSWNLALAVLALVVTQIAAAFDGLVTKRTFQLEIEDALDKANRARAVALDASSLLYLVLIAPERVLRVVPPSRPPSAFRSAADRFGSD